MQKNEKIFMVILIIFFENWRVFKRKESPICVGNKSTFKMYKNSTVGGTTCHISLENPVS